jgi:hypothetical protein
MLSRTRTLILLYFDDSCSNRGGALEASLAAGRHGGVSQAGLAAGHAWPRTATRRLLLLLTGERVLQLAAAGAGAVGAAVVQHLQRTRTP